jgi:sugar (pentulose or hexulose) kinase
MATPAGRVKLREAIDPLVLAIDIGSTASRGDVYDAAGGPVQGKRQKVPHQFTTRDDGTSEIDPDQIVGEVQQIITALATDRLSGRIRGVALDTFASSLWLLRRRPAPRLSCLTSPESAARVGRPTHGQCSQEFPQLRRARCFSAERWKASRSLTPGSPISFNRWPASRNGSWRVGG